LELEGREVLRVFPPQVDEKPKDADWSESRMIADAK
jgi:hypothetical protein